MVTTSTNQLQNPIQGLTPQGSPQVWGDPNAMFTLSQQMVALAEQFINSLAAQAAQLTAPVINPSFPMVANAPVPIEPIAPALQVVNWVVPTLPPAFSGTVNIGNVLPGPFTVPAPTLTFPIPPPAFTAIEPGSPAIDLNFVFPNVSVTLPSLPQLMQLDTVVFNPIVIPTFNATVPILQIAAPSVIPFKEGAFYTSTLLTSVENSLYNALQFGTDTALPPEIEANLFGRAQEREYLKKSDAIDALDEMELMGFAFPPGIYLNSRIKIETEFGYMTAGLSRDIMIKQAETTLANIVACREQAVNLEHRLIEYYNNIQQRAFEATKYATEASIAIYNGQIEAYKASLEGVRILALVYETQIKGIQAQIDELTAQIQFEKTKADINTALVAQYSAEVQAAQTIVDIFRLQVEIIQTEANIQKIKVDVFAQQIAAFVGQVNAYTAQIEGYKALVQTQGVIEQVYKDQVDAFAAEVNAGVAQANAIIAVFRGQIDAYTADLEGYKAAIEGMVGQAKAAAEYNEAAAAVYTAAANAANAFNNVLTAQWQAIINEQEKIAEIAVAAAKANGDLYIAAEGLMLDATKVGAQVAAQLGAAALGAIHWANNSSWGIQFSSVQEQIQSTSTATNTNINESA